MRSPLGKVGDIVHIKEWDRMYAEYGEFYSGTMAVPFGFNRDMEYLCGQAFIIEDIRWDLSLNTYRYELSDCERWAISEEMIDFDGGAIDEIENGSSDICSLFEVIGL